MLVLQLFMFQDTLNNFGAAAKFVWVEIYDDKDFLCKLRYYKKIHYYFYYLYDEFVVQLCYIVK